MCKHKILAHNSNGYIVQCNKCNKYQIGFGTTVACLNHGQLAEFIEQAEESKNHYQYEGFPEQKDIMLPLFVKNICMVVSYNELNRLLDLLTEANLSKEIDYLLKLNDVQSN